MKIRQNARWLTNQERTRFLKAILGLKGLYHHEGSLTMNVYDFYPLEHRIVRRRRLASNRTVDLGDGGHRGPAFLPWHREWLRRFEMDLRKIDSDVTLPYWDLLDIAGTRDVLFQDDFMAPNGSGSGLAVTSGFFRELVPDTDRPQWWPSDEKGDPLPGFPVRKSLSVQERTLKLQRPGFNTTTITRKFGVYSHVDPWSEFITRDEIEDLLDIRDYRTFSSRLEGIEFHAWGHVWIGGSHGRPSNFSKRPDVLSSSLHGRSCLGSVAGQARSVS